MQALHYAFLFVPNARLSTMAAERTGWIECAVAVDNQRNHPDTVAVAAADTVGVVAAADTVAAAA